MKFPSHCITVKDIYGTDDPKCPEGYEFTGEFRAPRRTEDILEPLPNNGTKVYNSVFNPSNWGDTKPRLVVRPVPVYSDSDIVDFFIHTTHNYYLHGQVGSLYDKMMGDEGDIPGEKLDRKTIHEEMRRQKWPHKSS